MGLCCLAIPLIAGSVALVIVLSRAQRRRPGRDSDLGERRPARAVRRTRAAATQSSRCPECGVSLPADAPEGLCPQCLLKGVISSAHGAARSAPAEATTPYGGPAAPPVEELAPLFPQLEILELIGQGGMGAVYKARQPSLDRIVAVKVVPREAGQDPAFAERFGREARALARLSHPNIVAVHDVGKAGDFYYFVMEYVDGVNLRQVLRDGKLMPEQALRIVPQICDALQYAHEEGVVHRDIKPENILLDRKGRVKIADFGLAKLLGRDTGNFTLTGSRQVMGTLYYMAPEQVERPLEVDHRADIYSLGVVFYEMLTGQLPVGRFPMPSEKAGTDAFLDEVVLRALERDPERRYQHASDVKTDLEGTRRRRAPAIERPTPHALLRRFVLSLAPWAALCCLVGLYECSLAPWIDVYAEGIVNGDAVNAAEQGGWAVQGQRGALMGSSAVAGRFHVKGAETGLGGTAAVLCLILTVWIVATSVLDPVPVWRPLIWVMAALAILSTSALFLLRFNSEKVALAARFAAIYPDVTVNKMMASPANAPYVACLVGVVLPVLGTAQLYRALRLGQHG